MNNYENLKQVAKQYGVDTDQCPLVAVFTISKVNNSKTIAIINQFKDIEYDEALDNIITSAIDNGFVYNIGGNENLKLVEMKNGINTVIAVFVKDDGNECLDFGDELTEKFNQDLLLQKLSIRRHIYTKNDIIDIDEYYPGQEGLNLFASFHNEVMEDKDYEFYFTKYGNSGYIAIYRKPLKGLPYAENNIFILSNDKEVM